MPIESSHDSPASQIIPTRFGMVGDRLPIIPGNGRRETVTAANPTTHDRELSRFSDAQGPYVYQETILKGDGREGSWRKQGTHNVTVVRLPDKRHALLPASAEPGSPPQKLTFDGLNLSMTETSISEQRR